MEFSSVDQYIKSFPEDIQPILQRLRKTIMDKAPDAKEEIISGIPAYKTKGNLLVYFSVNNESINFFATPIWQTEYSTEITEYKFRKGSVKFKLNKPIPFDLIGQIVTYRARENSQKVLI